MFQGLDGECEVSFSRASWSTPRLAKAIRTSDEIIFNLLQTPR
jgi:hypothetical protein